MPHYINIPAETSIWYEQRGSGFPLLLEDKLRVVKANTFWQRTAFNAPEVFSRHFHVITIDERNAGNSSGPLDVSDPWAGFAHDPTHLHGSGAGPRLQGAQAPHSGARVQ